MGSFCVAAFGHVMPADFQVADSLLGIGNAGGNNSLEQRVLLEHFSACLRGVRNVRHMHVGHQPQFKLIGCDNMRQWQKPLLHGGDDGRVNI